MTEAEKYKTSSSICKYAASRGGGTGNTWTNLFNFLMT